MMMLLSNINFSGNLTQKPDLMFSKTQTRQVNVDVIKAHRKVRSAPATSTVLNVTQSLINIYVLLRFSEPVQRI